MRKKEDLIIIFLLFFLLTGYVFPTNSPNIKVNCVLGNGIVIYFPEDKIEGLEIEGNNVINKTSSNIYGYYGSTRITFPTYDEPYYNNGYQSINLSITDIYEVNLFTTNTTIKAYESKYIIVLLGGIFIWLMFNLKHS